MNPNIIAATIIAIGMFIHAYAPKPITLAVGDGFLVGMSYPISYTHAACAPGVCAIPLAALRLNHKTSLADR